MPSVEFGVAIGIAAAALVVGAGITFLILFLVGKNKKTSANRKAEGILRDAKDKADRIVKNAQLDAKQSMFEAKQQNENDARQRKAEIAAEQQKLDLRVAAFDERENQLLRRTEALEAKSQSLDAQIESNKKRKEELDAKVDEIIKELEKVSGMSVQEAHDEIMSRVENKMAMEISAYIKNAEDEARDTAQAKAVDLLVSACQRYAQDVVTERTVSVVALPSDEMKGRIIGREGRNIRVLEQQLGVDLVIDDTPEAITVSCFDPIRREIARRSLEILVKDGRIQPGRIEDVVAKVKKEVDESCVKYGQEACFKLGLPRINRELLPYIGRLHYRTSYGQNALTHSMEVAYLAGLMAGELGLDTNLARRAGLLHDIGKAVVAVLLAEHLFPETVLAGIVAGVACVFGHMFPFYLKFRGGKGFASYLGMALALHWKFALVLLLAVVLITLVTDYIVLGTMTTVISFPAYCAVTQSMIAALILCAASLVIIYKHRSNLVRICHGTEIGLRSAHKGEHRVHK